MKCYILFIILTINLTLEPNPCQAKTWPKLSEIFNSRRALPEIPRAVILRRKLVEMGQQMKARHNNVTETRKQARIIGATLATKKFPWHVVTDFEDFGYFCSGTLITSRHVLTNALCADGYPVSTQPLSLYLGSNIVNVNPVCRDPSDPFTYRTGDFIYTHPDFNTNTLENDVSVIRMAVNVPIGKSNIGTVGVPLSPDLYSKYSILDTTRMEYSGIQDINADCQQIAYDISRPLSISLCRNYLFSMFEMDSFKYICTEASDGTECTTDGDEGSGLIAMRRPSKYHLKETTYKKGNKIFVPTVLGMYVPLEQTCDTGLPTAFVRITSIMDWLSELFGVYLFNIDSIRRSS